MKKVLKNIIALICVISMLGSLAAVAAGEAHIVYTRSADTKTITATATLPDSAENKVLVVSSYVNGLLKEIKTGRTLVGGKLSATVEAGVDEVIANVIDSFGGETASSKAVYAAEELDIRGIMVNGVEIENFSNEVNDYTLMCEAGEADIEVILKDSTTKVEISDNVSPGIAKIKLSTYRGGKRNINLNMYSSEEETYTLSNLTYLLGDQEYEIPDFDPNTYTYNVELPDNTMNIRLVPETAGIVKTYLTDTMVTSVDGVEIGKLYGTASEAYVYKRYAVNNLVPVKNEIANAEIVVSNGKEGRDAKETVYQIEFTARQPRLTELNFSGCAEDSEKPAFIGGSAVNNDNGTIITTQNGWAVGNISKKLLGGSMFMFADIRKSAWWLTNSATEDYFNFTADTPGTIYVISGETFKNTAAYSEAGWTKLPGTEPTNFPDWGVNYRQIRKDYNDWNVDYILSCLYYNSANAKEKRAIDPGIAQTTVFDEAEVTSRLMINGYSKTFEAGENVKIFNTGKSDWNAASICAVIKWDEDYVQYAPEFESESDAEGGEDVVLGDPLPPVDEVIIPPHEDIILDVEFNEETNTSSDVWNDKSGHENHITLDSSIGEWTENGYKIECGSGIIPLSDDVADIMETSNFTIQFELSEATVAESGEGIVIFSQNGEKFILSSATQVQLMGWSTVFQRPKFNYNLLVGKKHTVVVDGENSKLYWYIEGEDAPISKILSAPSSVSEIGLGTDISNCSGSVTFKSIRVYNKVLTADEITGGEAQ